MSIETPVSTGERTSWNLFRRYPLDVLWRFFATPGAAQVWLTCLLAATLAGAFFPQAPLRVDNDPTAYHRWLATIVPQYGSWGDWLSRLGLLNLRSALWYRGLWALAALSLLVMGVEQLGPRWRAWRGLSSRDPLSPLLHDVSETELRSTTSPDEVAEAVSASLRGKGYRLRTGLSPEGVMRLYAEKHGLAWVAPVVLHAGLLLVLLGAVVNQHWSWREGPFSLAAGETHPLAHAGGQVLRLDASWVEGTRVGSAGYFRSVLTLEGPEGGSRTVALRRNVPVLHDGILIHQVGSGPAVRVSASDPSGSPIALEPLGSSGGAQHEILLLLREGQNELWIGAPSRGIALHMSRHDSTRDAFQGEPVLRLRAYRGDESEPVVDQPLEGSTLFDVDGATYRLTVESYASILVVRSPGLVLPVVGSLLALVGCCLVGIPSPRCVWLDISGRRRNGSRVLVTTGGRRMGFWAGPLVDDLRRTVEVPSRRS